MFRMFRTEKFSLPERGSASTSGSITPKELEAASPSSEKTYNNTSLSVGPIHRRTWTKGWPKGWRPYATLFACWLLMFNSWGQVNAYGTFASYYSQHLFVGRDLWLFNFIGATQCFVILLLSGFVGRLLDAGHAKALAATGTALCFIGNLSLGFVNGQARSGDGNYPLTWLCQGLINGLGMSCFFVTSSQVAATWFPNCKAIVIGIVATGASCSGLIYPMMIKFLIARSGFATAVWGYTAVVTGTCVIATLILLIKNTDHVYRKPSSWLKLTVWMDKDALKDPAFRWLTAGICWMFFGFYAVFFNLEDWAASDGFAYKDVPSGLDIHLQHEVKDDAIRTFWMLCMLNASSTIGRLGAAFYAQRCGALFIHASVTFFAALLLLCLWTNTHTLAPALIFVIFYGAISGSVIGLPPASVAHVLSHPNPTPSTSTLRINNTTTNNTTNTNTTNTSEPKLPPPSAPPPQVNTKLGQWTGMMYTISAPFALAGPVIAGWLVSRYDKYLTVQLWSGFCLLVASMCFAVGALYLRRGGVGGVGGVSGIGGVNGVGWKWKGWRGGESKSAGS